MLLPSSPNQNNNWVRPEPVHPMSLRDRGTKSTSSQIYSSNKKKPAKECPSKKKPDEECSSGEVNTNEPIVEFLSLGDKISARRVLRKHNNEPTTKSPIKVTHPDLLNGGKSANINGSIMKDYGREPLSHPRNQPEKANGTASSYELRRKCKMAMPSVDDLELNKTTARDERQTVPSPISHPRNQLEEANGTKYSYVLRRKRKMAMCSGSNGRKIIVDDLEPKEMARVESQTIHGKKKINPELISKNSTIPETVRSLPLPDGDIAKGQESVVITVVNNVNDEKLPFFHYIPRNAFFENAHVNVSLARIGNSNCCANCEGNCLSLVTPCVCSYETGCKFAYTADGLVKEDFLNECISMNRDPDKQCKVFCDECPLKKSKNKDTAEPCEGHLVRKFIKECWLKCGCSQLCGNRVVQRGITRKLQVFMTPNGVGWGLRTLEDLPKGAFVCEYVGEVLTNAELSERNFLRKSKGEKHSYPVLLDADWCVEKVLDEDALCLDATHYGNVGRFINHRCHDSNMVEIPVEVDSPDHHYYHLAFFTTREVKALEELTWDYGIDFDDLDHPIKAFSCQCGSKSCRNTKRSNRNKNRSRSRRRRRGW